MRDAAIKQRVHPGEKNGRAKLTDAMVLELRQLAKHYSTATLMEIYGVSRMTIKRAVAGTTHWRHLG
jgi:hypothetical protein